MKGTKSMPKAKMGKMQHMMPGMPMKRMPGMPMMKMARTAKKRR